MLFAVARGKWIVSVPVASKARAYAVMNGLRDRRPAYAEAYRVVSLKVVRGDVP